jgi:predicted DNA-binding transcriptional regulator YafY
MAQRQSITSIITQGGRFRIVYKDHQGEITERCIDVDRIWTSRNGATCVFALCHRRNAYRSFDMARILAAMPDDSTVVTTFAQMPHILGPYMGKTDSASRLAGWD